MTRRTPQERFWEKVNKNGPISSYSPHLGPCWIWTAGLWGGGYGRFVTSTGVHAPAHRVSYEWIVGPIPPGLQLDHLCRVRSCVNPRHLEPVTNAENGRRGEGPAGTNSRKTECESGHPFDGPNTYIAPNGTRACRSCRAACERERRRRKREGVLP